MNTAGNANNTGYTGRLKDDATGLNDMQARYYDPIIGRFLSTDPIGYQDQLNLYAYVHNDPVNATDPTGEATCANADCSKATIDNFVRRDVPIDSSLQGNPNPIGATVTFRNDNPNGASPNQPVETKTAVTTEQAIKESGVDSVNINSTTGGTHSPTSLHGSGQAVDINRVDGKRVDDPANAGPVGKLQDAVANQPGVKENFGPTRNEKIGADGSVRSPSQAVIDQHKNHIHIGVDD